MTWQRARSPEQKEQRRAAILEAAATLYESQGLDRASLNAIAREAHISKANIYRYFESREQIFLHLVHDDYVEWTGALERALAPLAGCDDERAVARAMVQTLVERPRLASLASALASVLERNVSVEAVVTFKTSMMEVALRLANAVQVAMPGLTMEQTQRFLMTSQLLVAGMWPSAQPPPAVVEALKRPELQYACIDFEQHLEQALITFLVGLKAQAGR
jgi:AcrR family transcriptional regulator